MKGKGANRYPKVREFDHEGNAIWDIDFTDHGFPGQHTYPHQHEWLPCGKRGEAKPLFTSNQLDDKLKH